MRTIVTVSLPEQVASEVKKSVKSRGFASVSEYFRHLIREERERELSQTLLRTRSEFDQGKGKKLRSLRELR